MTVAGGAGLGKVGSATIGRLKHLDPIAPVGGDATAFAPSQHFLKYAQFDARLAPVMRLEEHAREETLAPRLHQIRTRWPDAHVRVLEPTWSGGRTRVLLVSRSENHLRKAIAVERVLWNGPGDRRFGAAVLASGRLLGFPRCCVESLARSGRTRTEDVERLRICRALRGGTSSMPPFLVPTVPCRPDCPRLTALVEAIAGADAGGWIQQWARTYAHGPPHWREWRDLTALLFLERPGQLALLRVTAVEDSGRLVRYEPVLTFCGDVRAHRIVEESVLRLSEGTITIGPDAPEGPTFAAGETALMRAEGPYDATYWRRRCG